MTPAGCLDADTLASLLETEGAERAPECVEHLDACPHCRQTLAELAADRSTWDRVALHLPLAGPGRPPALERVMAQLKSDTTLSSGPEEPASEEELRSILRAPERPELLGHLGRYEVQELIGSGGMGVVFRAFDPGLHRVVAIKVLAPQRAGSATARKRFVREGRAAATVTHDNVVSIYEVDETAGLPYLVMQYVAGESLQGRLDRAGPLEVEDVVRIGLQTASGLAAAHAQGLIHRDIKPANLLLENGVARVKITDFGLARMADDAGLTQNGVIAGTPEYMAPEQARGEPIDHRADLFSLGSVLYALCTGGPPFRGSTAVGVLRQVSDQEPPPVRALNEGVPAWLEAFIARLMAKAPADRFQSAAEVAELLEGYLAHLRQPATAPAPLFQTRRQGDQETRRSGRLFCLLVSWSPCLLILLFLAGAGLIAFGLTGTADGRRPGPVVVRQDFRAADLDPSVLQPLGPGVDRDGQGLRITLEAGPGPRHHKGFDTTFAVRGDFEVTVSYNVRAADPPETGYGVGIGLYAPIDPAAQDAASLARRLMPDGTVQFVSDRMTPAGGRVSHWVQKVASTSPVGRLRLERVGPVLRFLAADGAAAPFVLVDEVEFGAADLPFIRVEGDAGRSESGLDARVRDFTVWAEELPGAPGAAVTSARRLRGHAGPVHNLHFTPDGRLVSGSGWPHGDRTVRVWDLTTGRERVHVSTPDQVHSLDLTPDGRSALVGLGNGLILCLDLETGLVVRSLQGHGGAVGWVAFAPDSKHAFSAASDGTARMWDLAGGTEVARFRVQDRRARGCAVFPDGLRLLTADGGGLLQVWDVATRQEVRRIDVGRGRFINSLSLAADGRQALVGGVGGARLYDLETGRELRHFQQDQEQVHQAALSPDGRQLLTTSFDGTVRLWDAQTGALLRVLGSHTGFGLAVAFSPDGRLVAAGGGGEGGGRDYAPGTDHDIRLWDLTARPAEPAPRWPFDHRRWSAAAGCLCVVLALSLLGVWSYARRHVG
jgi:hypothetical protein